MKIPQTIMGVALVVLVILLFTSPRHRAPVYDASDEVTVQGVVQDVQQFYCPISGEVGTHLMVKTENGTVQVHVAPTRFLLSNNLSFSKGDQIQVVGSRIIYQGQSALIARTATRGAETIAFRETNGRPMWVN
jgi:DNA/RNA endonuclease YhcR with UshA esterase domain